MSFARNLIVDGQGITRKARAGDGMLASLSQTANAVDANSTIPLAAVLGGLYIRNGMTATRADTVPTGAQLDAALPDMDVGDALLIVISVTTAFALTFTAATGVTLAGKTVPASGFIYVLLSLDSRTAGVGAYTWRGL
jgi:hypothetical protein